LRPDRTSVHGRDDCTSITEADHLEGPEAAPIAAEPLDEDVGVTVDRGYVVGHRHSAPLGGTAVSGSQVVVEVRVTGNIVEREEQRIGANAFPFPRIVYGVVAVEIGELGRTSAGDAEPGLGRRPRADALVDVAVGRSFEG
jgi:hypothetical protein